jgi:hypothetical protein
MDTCKPHLWHDTSILRKLWEIESKQGEISHEACINSNVLQSCRCTYRNFTMEPSQQEHFGLMVFWGECSIKDCIIEENSGNRHLVGICVPGSSDTGPFCLSGLLNPGYATVGLSLSARMSRELAKACQSLAQLILLQYIMRNILLRIAAMV